MGFIINERHELLVPVEYPIPHNSTTDNRLLFGGTCMMGSFLQIGGSETHDDKGLYTTSLVGVLSVFLGALMREWSGGSSK